MRQGEIAPKGQWQGSATGGVEAPDPILLPSPATRFAVTADRLAERASGHPMAGWLAFMAGLARAQHKAAVLPVELYAPSRADIGRSVDARMPPLAADGHGRSPAWQEVFACLLVSIDPDLCPPPARALIETVREAPAEAVEKLASAFLAGNIAPEDAGPAVFVAAGLQVYFTRLASLLPLEALRLLPERGLCPCCGSLPSAGRVTATGKTPGTRYLHCSLCSSAWNHVRTVCITCGNGKDLELQSIEGSNGSVVAETCPSCSTYAKMLYQVKDMALDPYADDLASLALDLVLAEQGWARHAPNPLVLTA
jgi:FdhE protein